MAERNPFLDSDDPRPSVVAPPQVPISGNPFLPAPANAPPPATLMGNVADFMKPASNTFSLGMRDRLEGVQRALQGDAPSYSAGVDQAVADSAMRRERSPYLSVVGDVAGGTAQAFVPGAGAIGRGTAAALGGAAKGLPGVAARVAGYGLEGGLIGGAQAAGHTYSGNPSDYANNALVGGAFGAALGAPFGKFADVAPRNTAPVPDAARLKQSASQRYTDTHSVPIDYRTDQFRGAMDALEKRLYGITDPDKSKTVWHTINDARSGRLQADPDAPTVTPKDIDALRQKLTGVNEVGARQVRDFLDRFMASPIAQASGSDAQRNRITSLINDARGDYRAGKRTETVENTNQYADDRFNTANSAQNAGNTYRQKLVALLNPKSREGKWYNPEEKADIRDVTRGEAVANTLRTAGNYARGIGGLTAGGGGVAAALATGDLTPLLGAAIPVAGAAAKGISNRMTMNHARELEGKMAMRSPLYREWAAQAPIVAGPGLNNFAESSRNAITNQVLEQLRLRGVMQPEEQP
jgi:hypothetical protein